MRKWKECVLSDIGEIVGGATPSTKNESYYGGDIAWITPKDLSTYKGRYISHGERNITAAGLASCSSRIMPKHSVLFTSRAPIGYIAIAENEVCTNQGFKSVVPNADTDYRFLYYLLVYNRDRIEALGSGTTFKEVSGSVMKNITVSVPELAEQRYIGDVLSALDDKIEQNNAINHNFSLKRQADKYSVYTEIYQFDYCVNYDLT
jgi:type I restriction enzyme S subunit